MSDTFLRAAFAPTTLLSLLASIVSTGCSGFDILNAPVSSCGYIRTPDIAYGNVPRQKLDVYQPRGAPPNAKVVIFFYGGEWQAGEKWDYRFAGEALTSQGFVTVIPDYRLYPEVTFPKFVQDGALAFRWVHDNIARFGGDPTHIYLMGHSAGAHIASLLTLDPHYLADVGCSRSEIRAFIGLSGPYRFRPYAEDRQVFNMEPGDKYVDPRSQPINFVDGHGPPMLIVQGALDDVVGYNNGFDMTARIRRFGGDVRYISYINRSHETIVMALAWEFRWLAPVLRDVTKYIREH